MSRASRVRGPIVIVASGSESTYVWSRVRSSSLGSGRLPDKSVMAGAESAGRD